MPPGVLADIRKHESQVAVNSIICRKPEGNTAAAPAGTLPEKLEKAVPTPNSIHRCSREVRRNDCDLGECNISRYITIIFTSLLSKHPPIECQTSVLSRINRKFNDIYRPSSSSQS